MKLFSVAAGISKCIYTCCEISCLRNGCVSGSYQMPIVILLIHVKLVAIRVTYTAHYVIYISIHRRISSNFKCCTQNRWIPNDRTFNSFKGTDVTLIYSWIKAKVHWSDTRRHIDHYIPLPCVSECHQSRGPSQGMGYLFICMLKSRLAN